jgi:orotate phosphoribosyltransferase
MSVIEQGMPLNDRKRLILKDFIKRHGIVFGPVQLFSGIKSEYYYDIKNVEFHPKGIHLLGELLLREVAKYGAKSVGGMEMGAVPLATAIELTSTMNSRYSKGLNAFCIRKGAKQYGLEKKIEGNMVSPVVIVDDVLTSGTSTMDAIDAVTKEGISPKAVVFVVDRQEEGTPNLLKQNNIKYSSLFKHSDFRSFIEEKLKEKRQNRKIKSS